MPAPKRWSLQDAKNKLSEVVNAAASRGPQVVTRRGVDTAVVLSYPDYVRVATLIETPRPSFESFLQAMPRLPSGEVDIERIPIVPRDVDL